MCLASIIMSDRSSAPRIVDFKFDRAEATVSRPAPDRLLEGDPQHCARNFFSDPTGQMFAGVWESSPGRWRVSYTENEFCHITAGEVTIESVDGSCWSFGVGDSFVIPAGFSGTWWVRQPLRKLYVIFEPADLSA
jgi:uncharacterized cupin superfamily protein